MGILTRVRDIVGSNINAALDKAEDPEKLVKYMIREMEDTLVELKAACAGAMAAEKRAKRDADGARGQADHWSERAELAIERNRESLAREALHAKRHHLEEAASVEREVDQLSELVGQYKADILQIEAKLQEARERQRIMVRRHVHAVQKKRAQQSIRKLDTSQVFVKFEAYAQRLDRAEAEAELVNYGRTTHKTLEGEFRAMEKDQSIEDELQALKDARLRRQHPLAMNA